MVDALRGVAALGPSLGGLSDSQRAAVTWMRDATADLDGTALPGAGATWSRWTTLIDIAMVDLARARLAEGHLDALAILSELGATPDPVGAVWGVWTAEPERVRAAPRAGGWHLTGEKRWCSGAEALDRAVVSATAPDGPRLFVVDPVELAPVAGSWPAIGMEATASVTMRFDVDVSADTAVGPPRAYVDRLGFWHGGAGVAACWFGGALGVAERLRVAADDDGDRLMQAAWGRVKARLEGVAALLERSAHEIDAVPTDVAVARSRAMRLRIVVADAVRATLADAANGLGAGPPAHDRDHGRRVVDLDLYVRQLRPDSAAADFGALDPGERVQW